MSFSVFQLEQNFWHLFLFEESHIAHRKFQVHTQSLAISIDQKARNRTDSEKRFGVLVISQEPCAFSSCFFPGIKMRINMQKNPFQLFEEDKKWERFLCCCCHIWLRKPRVEV